ncbi:MAG: DUF58 domain-containing protein [Polyangiales bacterium]
MWGWLRGRAPAPSAPRPAPDVDLFDPAFQRTLEALAIVARRVFAGRMRAERRSRRVGSGIEFADHRPYATGDDIRAIDWNIYRRHRRLAVRMFHEEADITVHVLLDCSASMAVPSAARLVFAKRLAAAVAYIALANLDRVSVQTFSTGLGAALAPTRGKARVFKVFRFSRREPGGRHQLRERRPCLRRAHQTLGPRRRDHRWLRPGGHRARRGYAPPPRF